MCSLFTDFTDATNGAEKKGQKSNYYVKPDKPTMGWNTIIGFPMQHDKYTSAVS